MQAFAITYSIYGRVIDTVLSDENEDAATAQLFRLFNKDAQQQIVVKSVSPQVPQKEVTSMKKVTTLSINDALVSLNEKIDATSSVDAMIAQSDAIVAPVKKSFVKVSRIPVATPVTKEKKAIAVKPVKVVKEKKVPAEPKGHISKYIGQTPRTSLYREGKDTPKWVLACFPEKLRLPVEEFSFLGLYLLVRDLEPDYIHRTVRELVAVLLSWAAKSPDTAIGAWLLKMGKLQKMSLDARLEWVIVETLRQWDAQQQALQAPETASVAKSPKSKAKNVKAVSESPQGPTNAMTEADYVRGLEGDAGLLNLLEDVSVDESDLEDMGIDGEE